MAGAEDKPVLSNNIPREALLITIWVFFTVTTMLLIARYAIRLWLHRQLFWDDVFAGIAYVLLLGHNIAATLVAPAIYLMISTYFGVPKPPDFLDQVTYLVKLMFSANILFVLCLYSVKASLLALLWRLVKNLPRFRKAWWAIAAITAIGLVVTIILAPVACSDLRAFGCTAPDDIERDLITVRFTAASDILTDLLLMSLPVAFILTSYLPLPQKLGLVGLFALGFTVIAMSILRIVVNDNTSKHPPPSWLIFWSSMESAVAVMTSCFASFKSLFTLRKRPSAYARTSSYLQSKNKSGPLDASIALRSRIRNERSPATTKTDMNTVVISSESEANKWNDSDSREEILQRTEFEVRYERASTPGKSMATTTG
ncbi:predicted protein [Uncinocarpus reesii 1704]|uniref:Rhodopsin domain-containing protein n=1 Tax=Uncinocarpus reesii (strain UAMH 1704) TaxID=336963 RepID=C4JP66_UNCRE|nr:uncharacterized protein UREG_03125 [Uncinocarpus reesii 1704]EEP78280.1 predicted protein [Uncinocarpus reesii 1704]